MEETVAFAKLVESTGIVALAVHGRYSSCTFKERDRERNLQAECPHIKSLATIFSF